MEIEEEEMRRKVFWDKVGERLEMFFKDWRAGLKRRKVKEDGERILVKLINRKEVIYFFGTFVVIRGSLF